VTHTSAGQPAITTVIPRIAESGSQRCVQNRTDAYAEPLHPTHTGPLWARSKLRCWRLEGRRGIVSAAAVGLSKALVSSSRRAPADGPKHKRLGWRRRPGRAWCLHAGKHERDGWCIERLAPRHRVRRRGIPWPPAAGKGAVSSAGAKNSPIAPNEEPAARLYGFPLPRSLAGG
jgi:hypothetical protein